MKFETVEVVTTQELLKHLGLVIESNHKVSKSGGKRGGVLKTARHYGVSPQELANTINGYGKPPKRILEKEKLEAQTVYVRKKNIVDN